MTSFELGKVSPGDVRRRRAPVGFLSAPSHSAEIAASSRERATAAPTRAAPLACHRPASSRVGPTPPRRAGSGVCPLEWWDLRPGSPRGQQIESDGGAERHDKRRAETGQQRARRGRSHENDERGTPPARMGSAEPAAMRPVAQSSLPGRIAGRPTQPCDSRASVPPNTTTTIAAAMIPAGPGGTPASSCPSTVDGSMEARVTGSRALRIPPVDEPSPQNGEGEVPPAGRFRQPAATVGWRHARNPPSPPPTEPWVSYPITMTAEQTHGPPHVLIVGILVGVIVVGLIIKAVIGRKGSKGDAPRGGGTEQ